MKNIIAIAFVIITMLALTFAICFGAHWHYYTAAFSSLIAWVLYISNDEDNE